MGSGARLLVLLVGVAFGVSSTSIASGSTLQLLSRSGGGKTFEYRAEPGETNNASLQLSDGRWSLQESAGYAINAVPPCTADTGLGVGTHASCPTEGVDRILIDLGDMGDSGFSMSSSLGMTFRGGSGDDWLSGSGAGDVFVSGPGSDVMNGMFGSDRAEYSERTAPLVLTLNGQADDGELAERDTIGTDVEDVLGGSGPDVISGDDTANVLTGGAGKDKIGARGGNDIVRVRDGFADRVTCGSGLDVVTSDVRGIDRVGLSCEVVRRGRADRTLVGTGEDDILAGTPGPDVIVGLGGDDILLGFGGADRLRGGNGDDTATGGPGRDILKGGAGSDELVGGRGNDRVRARDGAEDRVDGGAGHDAASIDRFLDVVRRVEAFF